MQNNLELYLRTSGMTNIEFAKRIGITPITVYRYAKGKRKPDIETAQRMAKELDVSTDELFKSEDERETR